MCRITIPKYKGLGRKLIKYIIEFIKIYKPENNKLYLSVSAFNTSLQNYYKALGWISTHQYNSKSNKPEFEYMYII